MILRNRFRIFPCSIKKTWVTSHAIIVRTCDEIPLLSLDHNGTENSDFIALDEPIGARDFKSIGVEFRNENLFPDTRKCEELVSERSYLEDIRTMCFEKTPRLHENAFEKTSTLKLVAYKTMKGLTHKSRQTHNSNSLEQS